MADRTIKPLTTETWGAFAALAEKHHGVWGGCWCAWFHGDTPEDGKTAVGTQAFKRRLVERGVAHAALVFEGDAAIGWCQYGTPEQLPRISHRKQYEAGLVEPARYRITCFFVDRDHRRTGVARDALAGALGLIAAAGGGVVEAFPQDTGGARVSASFLHPGTRGMFERAGFAYERPLGKNHTLMRATVPAA